MQITGMAAVLSDCSPGMEALFTRWMDLDYVPEVLALPGVAAVYRYVAPQRSVDLHAAHGNPALEGGKGRWLNLVLFAADPVLAWEQMQEFDERRATVGRTFPGHKVVHVELGRFERTYAPRGAALVPHATPFIATRGLYLGVGDLLDEARAADVLKYYDDVHIPNMLSAPNVLGVTRYSSLPQVQSEQPGRRFLNTLAFDSDQPAKVVEGLRLHLHSLNQRFSEPGAYKMIYAGSYRRLEPLRA